MTTFIRHTEFLNVSNQDGVLLLDVRTPAEFQQSYFPQSINLPLQRLEVGVFDSTLLADVSRVLVLCGSGMRAKRAAEILSRTLDLPIHVLDGGIQALEPAALIHTDTSFVSIERQTQIVAGGLVLIALIAMQTISPWFALLAMFVGAGLVVSGVTNTCGMGMLLTRLPWNRAGTGSLSDAP